MKLLDDVTETDANPNPLQLVCDTYGGDLDRTRLQKLSERTGNVLLRTLKRTEQKTINPGNCVTIQDHHDETNIPVVAELAGLFWQQRRIHLMKTYLVVFGCVMCYNVAFVSDTQKSQDL